MDHHGVTVEGMEIVLRLLLAILIKISIVSGVQRHSVLIKGAILYKKRGEREVIGALGIISVCSKPICVEGTNRSF